MGQVQQQCCCSSAPVLGMMRLRSCVIPGISVCVLLLIAEVIVFCDVNLNFTSLNVKPRQRFLYMIQAERCIPDHLVSNESFGDTLYCQCDVLVLSYKQACPTIWPLHIQYLYNSSTTWTTGRNLLYEAAMKRSEKYLYYIFMDDDIVLQSNKIMTNISDPWRQFEDFLKRIEPAAAAVDASPNHHVRDVHIARQRKGCGLRKPAEYIPALGFDPAVMAFHYQSVEYLLPYPDRFDASTWWYSNMYVRVKCEILFRGQVVLPTTLRALNQLHRPYPRKTFDASELLALINEVDAELPRAYQNTTLLQGWKRDRLGHEIRSSTLCLPPPPPHMPIKPYAHFSNSTGVW